MNNELVQSEKIVGIIGKYIERKKNNNSSYSNRALARDLDLSPAFVSNVLNGKKILPYKHVDKIIKVLEMDQSDSVDLKLAYIPEEYHAPAVGKRLASKIKENWVVCTKTQTKVLSKWYYLPMLDLVTCVDFDGDFASALGISDEEAEQAASFLVDVGLLAKIDGQYRKTSLRLQFSSNVSREEFRNYHDRLLDRSKKELLKTSDEDFANRLIMSYSVAIPRKNRDYFKKRLADTIKDLVEEMRDGDCDQVYHFGYQFFPLSK